MRTIAALVLATALTGTVPASAQAGTRSHVLAIPQRGSNTMAARVAVTVRPVQSVTQELTRAITVVNGETVFDQTVIGAPTSAAGHAVIAAALSAAQSAGASPAAIASGFTTSISLSVTTVTISVSVGAVHLHQGLNGQHGGGKSGDAIGGQVITVDGSGNTSVDEADAATGARTSTGDADGTNQRSRGHSSSDKNI